MTDRIRLVAYGDCNTLGFQQCEGQAYPETVAACLGADIRNLGHTMSTTRELLQFARDYPAQQYQIAIIQYGLVDSWLTFRHSPYVLYYPNNPLRKLLRKLVKKLKKYARTFGIHELLGSVTVVPLEEYVSNIRAVISSAPDTRFYLVSTAPNLDEPRNPRIEEYNRALATLADEYSNARYVETYATLYPRRHELYFPDGTHLNAEGQAVVTQLVMAAIRTDEQ